MTKTDQPKGSNRLTVNKIIGKFAENNVQLWNAPTTMETIVKNHSRGNGFSTPKS